ncbi:MAG: hypothetical protein WCI74_03545 [Actinomycetes bacterium]
MIEGDLVQPRNRLAGWRMVVVLGGGLAFSIGIAATQPLQRGSLLVVSAAVAVVLIAGMRAPRAHPTRDVRLADALPWIALFVVGCLWEAAMALLGNNDTWPTLSVITDQWLDQAQYRFVAAAAWYGAAVWLIRRVSR